MSASAKNALLGWLAVLLLVCGLLQNLLIAPLVRSTIRDEMQKDQESMREIGVTMDAIEEQVRTMSNEGAQRAERLKVLERDTAMLRALVEMGRVKKDVGE